LVFFIKNRSRKSVCLIKNRSRKSVFLIKNRSQDQSALSQIGLENWSSLSPNICVMSFFRPIQVGYYKFAHPCLRKSPTICEICSNRPFSIDPVNSPCLEIAMTWAINAKFHGLVDPLFGTSWHKWNRYKLHRGIELDPWVKEWPPSWVYDLTHGTRRGLF